MSLFTKKTNEYDLSYKNDTGFTIAPTENSTSGSKWLSFPVEGEFFLFYSAILGSLDYVDYIFTFDKRNESEYLFVIENKRKSFLFKNHKKICSGVLFCEALVFERFLRLLRDKQESSSMIICRD